ncbi:hypothetical protein NAH09_09285, partial [Francisella tularensis subsp. holarctica]|nr:hypothetical protein [Francisella tularensis subsp. holarctica]
MKKLVNTALSLLPKFDTQVSALLLHINCKALSVNITDIDLIITLELEDSKIYASNELTIIILKGTVAVIVEIIFIKILQE